LYPTLVVPIIFQQDLGSSDCFLDLEFVVRNKLPYWEIVPLPVALIDGTVNAFVNHIVLLPIKLSCDYACTPEFFVMKLEGTYPVVLSYSWLAYCNPTINWTKGTICCQTPNIYYSVQLPKLPQAYAPTVSPKSLKPAPRKSPKP